MRFIIYSEPGVTKWGPEATGGSEGYHIELGKRLAAVGHEVISYSNLPDSYIPYTGDKIDGVIWKPAAWVDTKLEGVWIIQRSPDLAYKFSQPHPNQILLFAAHDLSYQQLDGKPPWSWMYDAILCESQVHAAYLKLAFGKDAIDNIVVSGTGFPMEDIDTIDLTHRDPKVIYHPVNPLRGLATLLVIFRRAWEEDRKLKLRVSYGMQYLDDMIAKFDTNGVMRKAKREILKLMEHPGVENLGRLATHKEVLQEHAKSGMFVYPTAFSECGCVNLFEAQSMGSIPIVSPMMALAEYTLHGCKIAGDVVADRLIQARFVREIVALANQPATQEAMRVPMMKEARAKFNFQDVVVRIEALAESIQTNKGKLIEEWA